MPIELFFPTIGLGLMSHPRACHLIREAGFDGVEVLTTSNNRSGSHQLVATATSYGLKLHWHQPWSRADNTQHWYNHVLGFLGMLEPMGYSLANVLPEHDDRPVVVYADRYTEARRYPNAWLQTCTVMGKQGAHTMPFAQFVEVVQNFHLPVVFDTQHFLEWYFGVYGVERLPGNKQTLLQALLMGWQLIGPYVREIHFNDCDPSLGNTLGRNLLPGTGILPLTAFAQAVCQSDWSGVVVPEVSPFHTWPYTGLELWRLEMIRHATNNMFAR